MGGLSTNWRLRNLHRAQYQRPSAPWNKLVPPQIRCATEAVGEASISKPSVRSDSVSNQVGDIRGGERRSEYVPIGNMR